MSAGPGKVEHLLRRLRAGDPDALAELMPLVYDQLHAVAHRCFQSEREGHTLNTTALVHEAYLRLAGAQVDWNDRVHFFAIAARLMRRILVDHARAQKRDKRGGGLAPVSLDQAASVADSSTTLLFLDGVLDRLYALDPRKAKAMELIYFGGMTYAEAAHSLAISEATLDRDLRLAKAWVNEELKALAP